jgi:hypothetical protein
MGDAGPETTPKSSKKTAVSTMGGAENGALDPDLVLVIEAWPAVDPQCRARIVIIVRRAVAEAAAASQKQTGG